MHKGKLRSIQLGESCRIIESCIYIVSNAYETVTERCRTRDVERAEGFIFKNCMVSVPEPAKAELKERITKKLTTSSDI